MKRKLSSKQMGQLFNLAMRGGAAHGLAYSKLIKEIDIKDIKLYKLSGTSAGALFGSLIACGYSYKEIKTILKKLPYDRIMRWERDVELEKGHYFSRFFKALAVLFFSKTFLFSKMKKMLEDNLSWEKVNKAGRVKELWICTIDKDMLASQFGFASKSSIIDMIVAMKKKKGFKKMSKTIKPIWFSQSGTYKYDAESDSLIKISSSKPELWKCVFSSFANQAFKDIDNEIPIRGGYYRFTALDGGVVDNHAVTCQDAGSFISISCSSGKSSGLSDWYRKKRKSIKNYYLRTETDPEKVAFLSFYNKLVNVEFGPNVKASNIFK